MKSSLIITQLMRMFQQPIPNNELQVRTTTFTSNGGPHVESDYPAPSAEAGNDTVFINTIKSVK